MVRLLATKESAVQPAADEPSEPAVPVSLETESPERSSKVGPFIVSLSIVMGLVLVGILIVALKARDKELAKASMAFKGKASGAVPVFHRPEVEAPKPPAPASPPVRQDEVPEVPVVPPPPKDERPKTGYQQQSPTQPMTEPKPEPRPEPKLERNSEPKAQSGKPNQDRKKNQQDLPDVSLVIPEDTRPEIKAIIKENVINLRSKNPSERAKAAEVLGELKEQGKPVRRLLCLAMLDNSKAVRIPAADALKNIDPKIQYLAVGLLSEENQIAWDAVLDKVRGLEDDGEPLTPLVAYFARRTVALEKASGDKAGVGRDFSVTLSRELICLSHIAKNDRAACQLIAAGLSNQSQEVRRSAIQALPRMKHGAQAVPSLIRMLKTDPANLAATIETLVALADKSTEERITEAIASFRYHKSEGVRKAVEDALNKLQNKKDS